MIGVAIPRVQHAAAEEFFELCKTPWRFCEVDDECDVLICSSTMARPNRARLTLVYAAAAHSEQDHLSVRAVLSYGGHRMPLYADSVTFARSSSRIAVEASTREPFTQTLTESGRTTTHIGYDLFAEVFLILAQGQPVSFAECPTIELHIALFRELILRAGLPFVEVPPAPEGFDFAACLTHDVDHPVLRNHCGDATMYGFLYRATIGSCLKVLQGRMPIARLWQNWKATAKLPFLYLGWGAKDDWRAFDDYLAIEAGKPSTFFVIPIAGNPGRRGFGRAPANRACKYTLHEIKEILEKIAAAGHEVALHGIDSWSGAESGRTERAAIKTIAGANDAGVRMHWLYFDHSSPLKLEAAGFVYDSTFGYNQTVGYRAGTTQVFRPPGTRSLLELPLHVMDTALFYPDYLNLGEPEARDLLTGLMDNATRFGGVFTVNWHDRSIAPERLWGDFYSHLLLQLQQRRAWFATASKAVEWFRLRRSVEFDAVELTAEQISFRARVSAIDSTIPNLKIRVYKPRSADSSTVMGLDSDAGFTDFPLRNNFELTVTL